MKIKTAVSKVEKKFGKKMNYTKANGQYFLNGLSFYEQQAKAICISVNGVFVDNITQALKRFA
jgi:hypothetical protein